MSHKQGIIMNVTKKTTSNKKGVNIMKIFSKKMILLTTAAVAMLSLGAVAFADSLKTPAQIYSEVTGKTVEQAITERQTSGESYGQLAQDAGKYEEFKSQMLENRKALLDEKVKSGQITQAQADAILERVENCEGPGQGACGNGLGNGFGRGGGCGMMNGAGKGNGFGQGNGQGSGQTK